MIWRVANDNFLLVCDDRDRDPVNAGGIRHALTGAVITGATGTADIRIGTAGGSALTGFTNPVTLVEQLPARPGVYLAPVPSTAALSHGQVLVAVVNLEKAGTGETYHEEQVITVETST